MKTSKFYSFISPFVITEDDVKKIYDIQVEFAGRSKIEIECSDHLNREMNTLSELFLYENTKKKVIKSLRLFGYGSGEYEGKSINITFSTSNISNIHTSIHGIENEVIILNEKINDIVEGIKPWYSFLSRIDPYYLIFGLSFITLLFVGVGILIGLIAPSKNPSSASSNEQIAVGFLIAFLLLSSGFILDWIKKIIFPTCFFSIGQGKNRYKNLEMFRWVVMVGLVISILAGIFLKFI